MEIIGYSKKYFENLAGLIDELNNHIVSIDTKGLVKPFKSPEAIEAYTEKTIKDAEELNGFIYLAIKEKIAVGFIQGVIIPKDNELFDQLTHDKYLEGWIGELYVKKEYREQGIGKKLYDKAVAHFKKNNCIHVRLIVLNGNKDAVKVYEKNGFETRGLNMIKDL